MNTFEAYRRPLISRLTEKVSAEVPDGSTFVVLLAEPGAVNGMQYASNGDRPAMAAFLRRAADMLDGGTT